MTRRANSSCSLFLLLLPLLLLHSGAVQSKFTSHKLYLDLQYPNSLSFIFWHNGVLYGTVGYIMEDATTKATAYIYQYSSDFQTVERSFEFPQKCGSTPCQAGVVAMDVQGDMGYFQFVNNMESKARQVGIYIYTIELPSLTLIEELVIPSMTPVAWAWLPFSSSLDILMSDNPTEQINNLTLSSNGTVYGPPLDIGYFFYYGFGMGEVNNTNNLFTCGVRIPEVYKYKFMLFDTSTMTEITNFSLEDRYCAMGIINPPTQLFVTYNVFLYEYLELAVIPMNTSLPSKIEYQRIASVDNGMPSQFNFDGSFAFLGTNYGDPARGSSFYQVAIDSYQIYDAINSTYLIGANELYTSPFSLTMSQVREFGINYNVNGSSINQLAVIINQPTLSENLANGFAILEYDDQMNSSL